MMPYSIPTNKDEPEKGETKMSIGISNVKEKYKDLDANSMAVYSQLLYI
jgi:hypothetical protein